MFQPPLSNVPNYAGAVYRLLSQSAAEAASASGGRTVPLALIKEVRARSGAPLASVREALEAVQCDVDAALEHLRRRGARLAASRASRPAGEGLVGIALSETADCAALVELRCETDFVARTGVFHDALAILTRSALGAAGKSSDTNLDIRELEGTAGNDSVLASAAAVLGENVRLGRACAVRGATVGTYLHGRLTQPNDAKEDPLDAGRIGVGLALQGGSNVEDMKQAASQLAMHVAADAPLYISRGAVPADVLQRETDILLEAVRGEPVKPGAKPRSEDIVQKIVHGRLQKWLSEVILEEQIMITSENGGANGNKPVAVRKWLGRMLPGVHVASLARLAV